jgi:hypothetical protein
MAITRAHPTSVSHGRTNGGGSKLQAKTTTYMYSKAAWKESAQRSAWEADWKIRTQPTGNTQEYAMYNATCGLSRGDFRTLQQTSIPDGPGDTYKYERS